MNEWFNSLRLFYDKARGEGYGEGHGEVGDALNKKPAKGLKVESFILRSLNQLWHYYCQVKEHYPEVPVYVMANGVEEDEARFIDSLRVYYLYNYINEALKGESWGLGVTTNRLLVNCPLNFWSIKKMFKEVGQHWAVFDLKGAKTVLLF